MRATHPLARRQVLFGALGAGTAALLSACGASATARSSVSVSGSATGGTVAVQDLLGPISVPRDTQRLAVLDQEVLGNALALGFPVEHIVGWARGSDPLSNYPHLTALGNIGQIPNLKASASKPDAEEILAVSPDLVLWVGEQDKTTKDSFTALRAAGLDAFCAFAGYLTIDDVMHLLRDVGVALQREDTAAQKEKDFRARVAGIKAKLDAKGPLPSAAFLRVTPWDGSYISVVVPQLDALKLPGKRPTTKQFYIELSAENLPQMTHDYLFVGDAGNRAKTEAALAKNKLFQQLPAVKAGHTMMVRDSTWGQGYSLPAAASILDDIETRLL